MRSLVRRLARANGPCVTCWAKRCEQASVAADRASRRSGDVAADRGRMSMDANPIDVHRATDAVLAQLDQLAAKYPHLLFIARAIYTGG